MSDLVRTNPVVYDNNLPTNYFVEYIRALLQRVEQLETDNTALEARVTALETP